MSLKLIAPGRRKGNRFYVARGKIAGRLYEVSTGATDKAAAEKFKVGLESRIRESGADDLTEPLTFRAAAAAYEQFRAPALDDCRRLQRLVDHIGGRSVADIRQDDLVSAARFLYPDAKHSSLNRNVITPASAVLHYAAENGHCEWRRLKRFREQRPVTRAISIEAADSLIEAAAGDVRLLLLLLFRQGTRISDTLRLSWEQVDMQARTMRLHIAKTDEVRVFPVDQDVFFALANRGGERKGCILPWRNRWQAYRALESTVGAAGVRFTPHMARHSLGTWLNASGAGLRTIMGVLGHADPKSSIRYQDADVEVIRAAVRKVGKMVGKRGKPRMKTGG